MFLALAGLMGLVSSAEVYRKALVPAEPLALTNKVMRIVWD